jgi:hypothetical protein
MTIGQRGHGLVPVHYNFVRIHQTLRCTPAMAANVTLKPWELSDMVKVLEDWEARQSQVS